MTESPTVFLVDDDSDFLELESRILAAGGCATVCFTDPREALAALTAPDAVRPALVVTDVMMTSLDSGFTFARAVKSHPRCAGIPVIIVSAIVIQKGFDFRPHSAADLAAMYADAFFDKPVEPEAFLARVRELLR